uniref:Vitellogenin domain-containing protein n=1 Tax=Strigamia maritima TaxID=126957 RepID=T1IP65_STRMM
MASILSPCQLEAVVVTRDNPVALLHLPATIPTSHYNFSNHDTPNTILHYFTPLQPPPERFLFFCLEGFLFFPLVTTLQYEVGVSYEYQYKSVVSFTESRPDQSQVAFQVSSMIEVKSIWQNGDRQQLLLLKMQPQLLVKPKGKNLFEGHPSMLDSIPSNPVVFALDEGRITHFFATSNEDIDLLNLKRGVVSLFQLQQVTGETQEIDASGKCSVHYKISGKTTTKVKKSCWNNNQDTKNFLYIDKTFDTNLKSHQKVTYQFTADDFIIQAAEGEEQFHQDVMPLLSTAASVTSKQKMVLVKQIQEENPFQGNTIEQVVESVSKTLKTQLSLMDINLSKSQIKPHSQTLSAFVRERKDILSNKRLAKNKSANGFLQVLNYFRHSSKEEITAVLKDPKNKNILPSLLDLAAFAQTSEAFQSAMEILPNIHNPDTIERFLLALGVVPQPTEEMIQSIKGLIVGQDLKEPKLEETAILMLASLIRTHCKTNDNCKNKIPRAALNSLTLQLENCKDSSCFLTFLRAMRNAAQPSTIPLLMKVVEKGGKISTWALQALKAIPRQYISAEVKTSLMQVYNQIKRRHLSTTRLFAADVVLESDPTEEDINDIIKELFEVNEMSTYLLSRLKELAQNNYKLRDKLTKVLKQKNIDNYDVLSQPGISTAFTSLLAGHDETNITYGLHMELAKGGLVKQSIFDVIANHYQSSLPLISFSIFASGLSGLADEVVEDDNGDATAGIELTIMDAALRPYVFFVGQADLMSHVWSGTASEPTNILQGNFLVHDSHCRIALSSGFLLDFSSKGVTSVDMSGAVQVSLWNRNGHSDVTTKTATVIQSSARINSNLVSMSLQSSSATEGSLNFVTDTEFYESPAKMCTQMLQPDVLVKYVIRKTESIPNTKHRLQRTKKRTEMVLGKCFALHPKNDALCGIMLES